MTEDSYKCPFQAQQDAIARYHPPETDIHGNPTGRNAFGRVANKGAVGYVPPPEDQPNPQQS